MAKYHPTKEYPVDVIANFYIRLSNRDMIDVGVPEGITNLKLQKILYFAQAAHLALYGPPLFRDDIQAWEYGPVIESIYHKYKEYGNQPLPVPPGDEPIQDPGLSDFLGSVWSLFEKYSASELISITHKHTPWKDTYMRGANRVIDPSVIGEYYKQIFVLEDDAEA